MNEIHRPLPNPDFDAGTSTRMFSTCQECGEEWPCARSKSNQSPVAITGVWLHTGERDEDIEVCVEVGGRWLRAISESHWPGEPMSHIAEPLGLRIAGPCSVPSPRPHQ